MKRFIFCASILFLCWVTTLAQGKLDLTSQAMLHRAKLAEKETLQKSKIKLLQHEQSFPEARQAMTALVKLKEGKTTEQLSADGFGVTPLRGGFAIVTCSAEDASRLAEHHSVEKCEFNRQRGFSMDKAREITGVNTLHKGLELPQTFTGKNVVTGIVDGGFDPNHINFKDAEGNNRFRYFATVEPANTATGLRINKYTTEEQISHFTTDDNSQTHGTHTLGIMAGSFMGEAVVANYSDSAGIQVEEAKKNPYYGIAYESKLYASTGASHDALIAYGVDGILEHRWENDHYLPVVINLSLGGNQGPHDGTGILTQYLDTVALTDGAIFCISSGNEGDLPLSYHKTFTNEDNSFSTLIRPYRYTDMRYGIVELYSDTEEDFDVSVIIYNNARKKVARTFPLNNKDGQIQYIVSSSEYQQNETDIVDATFARAYDGYVGIGGMIDQYSGRFYVAIDYYVENSTNNPADDSTEAQYTLGFTVTGKNGQRVDCYCDGLFTALDSYGYAGFVNGMRNGTISDIACGKHTITVGSYNTKQASAGIKGDMLSYEESFPEGEVTPFSSFATLADGRNLPHLLAPGCLIVSSMSTPYFKNPANGISEQVTTVKFNDGNRNHYFYPMMGTSMSSPFVAGVVALMLEANPNLNYKDVRDILIQTAIVDNNIKKVEDPVQYGAGKINALAAVKEALKASSIDNIYNEENQRSLFIPTGERTFNIYVAGASHVDAVVCNSAGYQVLKATSKSNEIDIDVNSLLPGIYFININGKESRKFVIK